MAELSKEQLSRFGSKEDINAVLALTVSDINLIDSWLLDAVSHRWQKVAKVVATAIMTSDKLQKLEEIPDLYFGMRIEHMVKNNLLKSEGNLKEMRFSEIKHGSNN